MANDYFDYIEPIPIDALATCGKEDKEYNPFCDNSSEKIGNTNYIISVSCEGTEAILEKIKRLLFDDSGTEKEEYA